jgi:hypothetical protein
VRYAEAHVAPPVNTHPSIGRIWSAILQSVVIGLIVLSSRVPTFAAAPRPAVSAQKLEAVYLLNFGRFVSWPASDFTDARAPLIIGVLGRDPFGRFLDDVVKGETIGQHPVIVRRFVSVREVDRCHILFVSESESPRLETIISELADRHILTVSDIPDFAYRGGIIQFLNERERVRFRINLQRAKNSSLELSAKLLRPADVVFQGDTPLYATVTMERAARGMRQHSAVAMLTPSSVFALPRFHRAAGADEGAVRSSVASSSHR